MRPDQPEGLPRGPSNVPPIVAQPFDQGCTADASPICPRPPPRPVERTAYRRQPFEQGWHGGCVPDLPEGLPRGLSNVPAIVTEPFDQGGHGGCVPDLPEGLRRGLSNAPSPPPASRPVPAVSASRGPSQPRAGRVATNSGLRKERRHCAHELPSKARGDRPRPRLVRAKHARRSG